MTNRRAIAYAVLVHLALLAVIVVGIRWEARPQVAVRPMQARAITDVETRREVERRKRDEQEREQAAARKQREQQEQARRQAEEKRRLEQEKRAEQKRKVDEQRKAEAEKKRLAEQKKKERTERQKAAEQSMKEQLAREEQERTESRRQAEQAAAAESELARYEGLIRQKVERNWQRPVSWSRGMECIVRVRLVPTGVVISATVIRSSGNLAFDRSVENAVQKASPLPLPEDKTLFEHFRELELRFRPEGQV